MDNGIIVLTDAPKGNNNPKKENKAQRIITTTALTKKEQVDALVFSVMSLVKSGVAVIVHRETDHLVSYIFDFYERYILIRDYSTGEQKNAQWEEFFQEGDYITFLESLEPLLLTHLQFLEKYFYGQ